MSRDPHDSRPNIFPAFRYRRAPQAIAWLERAFGFERQLLVPGPEGTVAHAQLRLGSGLIMLGSAPAEPDPGSPWDAAGFGVYVHVQEIDAHYRRARAAGAEIVRELAETEYGSREYSARDPEGNLWSFGTYQPLDESG